MFLSERHNAIVYEHPQPARVTASVPNARQLNGNLVAVPFDLASMQLCRFIGLPAWSPIERNYDWPGKFKPFAHQRTMAAFMTLHPRSLNLADMGCGKTIATLWAADYLMTLGLVKRALIVSPLSTLNRVWGDEIFHHFLGRRRAALLYGDARGRLGNLQADADFYIINHDGLAIGATKSQSRGLSLGPLGEALRDRPDINLVVVDEASAFKDAATRRWKLLRQISERKPYLWLLTGTPTPNAPTDAYALRKLLSQPDSQFESWMTFRDRTMVRVSQFKWVARKDAAETVGRWLQPAVRFAREECLDLPPLTVEMRDVELSPAQKKAMEELKRDLKLVMKSGKTITAVNEAVLRSKLLQIACGAVYGADREAHATDCAPRLAVLKEIIDQAPAKVLVFAPFTSIVNLIYDALRKEGHAVEKVTGDVPQSQRSDIFRRFQQEAEPRCIVADPGTMAHGLTLTAAATTVWYGPTDRPELYEQGNARINRPGQVNSMLVVQLASTTVEREIFKRLQDKASLQGAILDLVKGER